MTDSPARLQSKEQLESRLADAFAELGIPWVIHRHPPLRTVEESKALRGAFGGAHIKNLLVRDKKRTMWLVTVDENHPTDLKALKTELGARGNLSFASADLLLETLGVAPGAVTPLAVMNDPDGRVTAVLDSRLLDAELVNCHPLHNEATVAVKPDDLLRFMKAYGREPLIHVFADESRSSS